MRASGLALVAGSHRNMVKSSLPLASRSGRPPHAASYLRRHCACHALVNVVGLEHPCHMNSPWWNPDCITLPIAHPGNGKSWLQ